MDEYNTAGAATYLGVSEASVRRWADGGALRVRRVGRRRERRFREEDLRAFVQRSREDVPRRNARGRPLSARVGTLDLPVGTHLAAFYDTDPGRYRLSVPFLRDGLRQGEPGILLAEETVLGDYLAALDEALGGGVAAALKSGLLRTLSSPGRLAEEALATWEKEFWRTRTSGARMVRAVGDVVAAARAMGSHGAVVSLENSLNAMVKRFPTVMLCTYDIRVFDTAMMVEAIKAHPDMFNFGLQHFLP
ncbi:MAG: transcriptional repressor of dcmA and dcmR [Chloroflexota bacterium]|nr:transcriptional repressor of dcmA and dcmR [Chloroflexota bacterium]